MNFIADALTFLRFPAAIGALALILSDQWALAVFVFIVAILSDALDGAAARKWPPKDRWYRKDPHIFDNAADGLMFYAALSALAFKVSGIWSYALPVSLIGSIVILVLIKKLRPSRAERLDVVYGWLYAVLLIAMLIQVTVLAADGLVLVILVALYGMVTCVIVVYKWERVKSRPEVVYSGTW
ncbi:MAG: CDP-alcohol phosphatidyltransferase family protein [Proteobacteria bacterium]|nr:MAG: CDP-alcohol phosphatidyltransferase family protein [Pseudomonadota bacterium]